MKANDDLTTTPPCICGTVQVLASHPGSQVLYDAECKEFRFEMDLGNLLKVVPIHYCFVCGGMVSAKAQLPFDASEEIEILELRQRIHTISDALCVIGPPDEDICGISEPHGELGSVKRSLVYRRRWNTFYVWVCEYDNGGIGFIFGPKPPGIDERQ